ncbi:MAG: PhnD/SsuA/transferrin family substrate-binding protein [Anaerolineaceae bacterium]
MRKSVYAVLAMLVGISMLISACGSTATQESTGVIELTATSEPIVIVKSTPAPGEWGSADKPIILAFRPSSSSSEITASGQELLNELVNETDLVFNGVIPTSYADLVEAMGSGNAQIGWMYTPAYINAHEKGYADAALIIQHNGSEYMGSQLFIANTSSGFTQVVSTPDTEADLSALLQFKGKKACFIDPLNFLGYVIPLILLKNAGLTDADIPEPVFTGGNSQTVQVLYDGGICDYGALYFDARSSIAKDHPDVNEKVVVIFQTNSIYPNDNISYAPDLPQDLRDVITAAMLKIAGTEAGNKTLNDLFGSSGGEFTQVDDTAYDQLRSYLTASGIELSQLIK